MTAGDEYVEAGYILLGLLAGVLAAILCFILIRRWKSGSLSTICQDFFQELGYRRHPADFEQASFRDTAPLGAWRASGAWTSRPLSLHRHSSPRPPSGLLTDNGDVTEHGSSRTSTASSYQAVPLTVIQEED